MRHLLFSALLFGESELLTFWKHCAVNYPAPILYFLKYKIGAGYARFQKISSERLSNPIRYPRFHVSASEMLQSAAFAFGVPHDINRFHPYTMSSADPSHPQVLPFPLHFPG